MDLNVKSPFFLIQALLGTLRASASRQRPAKVINIASIDGLSVNMQDTYSYAASKAGLIHLTKRLALELAPENIVVSAIAPGAFASNMNKLARDEGEAVAKRIPALRIGTPEDMAGAAIFLASRAGDYVVGATLVVDGGIAWTRQGFRMTACRELGVYATARLGLNRWSRRGAIRAAVGGRNRDGAGFWRRRFIAR